MLRTDFQNLSLPLLGFGAMRLPTDANGSINETALADMLRTAMDSGLNYFDTAYPYHSGMSEIVLGRLLKKYPRESFFLADKFPGHQVLSDYTPSVIFEEQLRKCGVEYFDFYLLHNVYENSIATYLAPRWGILDYFREQKRLGRIRHLGFSTHGGVENLKEFLSICGEDMEFCQIQLNWMDWTLQNAAEKAALLHTYKIPIWVMEPVRGGLLCRLDEEDAAALRALRPDESIPAWSFRFLQEIPGVQMILSGMSNADQLNDNIRTFADRRPLSEPEKQLLFSIADKMKNSVPCTGCRYCTKECPMELDIPALLSLYNDLRVAPALNIPMRLDAFPEDKRPSACIACGACTAICPQKINIPAEMHDFAEKIASMPKWAEVCRQREEAAKKLKF